MFSQDMMIISPDQAAIPPAFFSNPYKEKSMDKLGPPWEYIKPKVFNSFAAIMGFIAAILLILIIAFFVNKFFKYRHEIKIARIQSGNLDPMHTHAGVFLILRRGIIIMLCGINVAFSALFDSPVPLAFLPFTLG